jgi:hypothetical protein
LPSQHSAQPPPHAHSPQFSLSLSFFDAQPSKEPEHWNLLEIFGTAIVLGTYLTISTIVLFHLAVYTDSFERWFGLPHLTAAEARGLIYLQVLLDLPSPPLPLRSSKPGRTALLTELLPPPSNRCPSLVSRPSS